MHKKLVAKAETTIDAPVARVWEALVDPERAKKYMFGATVASDFKEGSPITWSGEWNGKPFVDKGVILKVEPGRRLAYTHFSPLTGLPDVPENYHTVEITLQDQGGKTRVTLTQDNNETEEVRAHSEANWVQMLKVMKEVVEG